MKRVMIAFAAAGLLALPSAVEAQSYNDLRARAICQDVGASGAEMASCMASVKRQMFMRNLGQTLQNLDRQRYQQPSYTGQYHPWIGPPLGSRQAPTPRQEYCWLGHNC